MVNLNIKKDNYLCTYSARTQCRMCTYNSVTRHYRVHGLMTKLDIAVIRAYQPGMTYGNINNILKPKFYINICEFNRLMKIISGKGETNVQSQIDQYVQEKKEVGGTCLT